MTSAYQVNQTAPQLISTLMSILATYRVQQGVAFDIGLSTYPAAFDGYQGGKTSVFQAFTDIANSEPFSRWYYDRDGTFQWHNRNWLALQQNSTPKWTLTIGDTAWTMVSAMDLNRVVTKCMLKYYPRSTDVAATVLATSPSTLQVPPKLNSGAGGTLNVRLTFRDPNGGRIIGAYNVISPVANTDYTVNEFIDKTGVDYTTSSYFTMTVNSTSASEIDVTFTNTASGALYIFGFQVRGQAVKAYDSQTISASNSGLGTEPYINYKEMPLAYEPALLQQYANAQLLFYTPMPEVEQLQIDNKTTLNGVDLLSLELGDVIAIPSDNQSFGSQTFTGPYKHLITQISYQFEPGDQYQTRITFGLMRITLPSGNTWGIYDTSKYDTGNVKYWI